MANGFDTTSSFGSDIAGIFNNPDFQQMLLGIGSNLGGEGSVASAIAQPTSALIRSRQAGNAVNEERQQELELMQSLLSGRTGGLAGIVQSQNNPITEIKTDKNGTTIKTAPPSTEGGNKDMIMGSLGNMNLEGGVADATPFGQGTLPRPELLNLYKDVLSNPRRSGR